MPTIKQIFKPAGAIVGALIVIAGYISTGKDVASWGLPVWIWQATGATLFFGSIIAILYGQQRKIDALNSKPIVKENIRQTSLVQQFAWVEGLVNDQWNNPQTYVYCRLIKVFPSPPTEIGIVVEWFNCSIFDLKFESVKGEIKMGEVNIDTESLGHQITLIGEPTLNACRSCTCTCYVQVLDRRKTDQFRDAIAKDRALMWGLNLNWNLSTIGFSRPISIQQSPTEAITMVPSRS